MKRGLFAGAAVLVGSIAAASAQAPGRSQAERGGTVPDLRSGVRGGMSTQAPEMSKPGSPGYGAGVPGSMPNDAATAYGMFGTGMGGAGMAPATDGTRR